MGLKYAAIALITALVVVGLCEWKMKSESGWTRQTVTNNSACPQICSLLEMEKLSTYAIAAFNHSFGANWRTGRTIPRRSRSNRMG